MTIRKQLILIISSLIFLAVLIYSLISTGYINSEFSGYVTSQYTDTIDRVKAQATEVLSGSITDKAQVEQTLSVYLSGLISQISVLDSDGGAIVTIQDNMGMMHNNMMRRQTEEKDYFIISKDGADLGTLAITRTSAVQDSQTVLLFKKTLVTSAVISGLFALFVSIVVIVFVSNKMTRDLRHTAAYAGNADSESVVRLAPSKVVEIRAIQQSLEDLSSKLKLQKRARQEKIDQLSHEVRTPLSILKTNCEAARDKVVEMDDSRLDSCLTEIDHLSSMLEAITDVIEYDNGTVNVNREDFDLCEVLRHIVKGFRLQYEKKGIALNQDGEKHLTLNADKSLLTQAVYNLLSNAYKFIPPGGHVTVFADVVNGQATLCVCDDGPGIQEQDLSRIFEAYDRGSTLQDIKGEGLGLFIARRNIEAMGGSISAKNRAQGGACFTIEIPVNPS